MSTNSNLRDPLARVRGLGSARSGVTHWWQQRVTAAALVILAVLLIATILALMGANYGTVRMTLGSPLPGVVVLLFIVAAFWHLRLGGQVIIEDYVHSEGAKMVAVVVLTFACIAVGLLCALAELSLIIGA